ncbi:MAG TPA: M17 family peptidase N-terminal domain-containing protein, partial [Planctomycetota bacterium]|nr:M17 family peptidase N-terminal domain-containing protein [Planctomycetota bacterium]
MNIVAGAPKGETLARFVFEGDLGPLAAAAKDNNFSGKEREVLVSYPGKPAKRVIAAGLGKKEKLTVEKVRRAAASIALRAKALGLAEFSIVPPSGNAAEHTRAVVEGVALALYEYKRYKSRNNKLHGIKT